MPVETPVRMEIFRPVRVHVYEQSVVPFDLQSETLRLFPAVCQRAVQFELGGKIYIMANQYTRDGVTVYFGLTLGGWREHCKLGNVEIYDGNGVRIDGNEADEPEAAMHPLDRRPRLPLFHRQPEPRPTLQVDGSEYALCVIRSLAPTTKPPTLGSRPYKRKHRRL